MKITKKSKYNNDSYLNLSIIFGMDLAVIYVCKSILNNTKEGTYNERVQTKC